MQGRLTLSTLTHISIHNSLFTWFIIHILIQKKKKTFYSLHRFFSFDKERNFIDYKYTRYKIWQLGGSQNTHPSGKKHTVVSSQQRKYKIITKLNGKITKSEHGWTKTPHINLTPQPDLLYAQFGCKPDAKRYWPPWNQQEVDGHYPKSALGEVGHPHGEISCKHSRRTKK